jgi:6,7-dimethyl-8-ribityllumazine synthase
MKEIAIDSAALLCAWVPWVTLGNLGCPAELCYFSRALILQTSSMEYCMNQTHSVLSSPSHSSARAQNLRIAVVSSTWHQELVGQAVKALLSELQKHSVPPERVDKFEVPGAFEIPLFAKRLAERGRFDAIVACALVVDGGIYRHEFVASAVIDGLMRVQLDTGVPVISVVLTPQHFHEHGDHQRFFTNHLQIKGVEAAHACLNAVAALRELEALPLAA